MGKKYFLGLLFVFMLVLVVHPISAVWYNTSWVQRLPITFNASQIHGSHQNFTALIKMTNTTLISAQSDGDDFVFADLSGNKLSHEIDIWNNVTGELVAWVKIPTFNSTTGIYLYFNNSAVSNQENVSDVWADYAAVWHLSETSYTAGVYDIIDSSPNGNNGTVSAQFDANVSSVVTNIGRGFNFSTGGSSGESITVPDSVSLSPTGKALTISAYIKTPSTFQNAYNVIFEKTFNENNTVPYASYMLYMGNNAILNKFHAGAANTTSWVLGTNAMICSALSQPLVNTYYGITFLKTATHHYSYVNGVLGNSNANSFSLVDSAYELRIAGNPVNAENFKGVIDEIMITAQSRSAERIETEYNSMASQGFLIFNEDTPAVSLWYGDAQKFGQLGNPTYWVNVLGNAVLVANMSYSLNGGVSNVLTIGADTRRLLTNGDFNIEINRSSLINGINNVTITATNTFGNSTTKNMTINYTSGVTWSLPYLINWSAVSNISDVAEVVDGKWEITANGLHIVDIGYDRLVAIGNINWTDYEITVPITIHNASNIDDITSGTAGVGLMMRWKGASDDPVSGRQPKTGWRPFGAIGWYRWNNTWNETKANLQIHREISGVNTDLNSVSSVAPTNNVSYTYKMRVTTGGSSISTYNIKTWLTNESEPTSWNLNVTESSPGATSGSVVLLAHHVNATFGNINITQIVNTSNPTVPTSLIINNTLFVGDTLFANASGSTDSDGGNLNYYYEFYNINDSSTVQEYASVNGWNVSSAVYVQRFSVGGHDEAPFGVFFRSDGLRMYTIGVIGDSVYEYSLSTAWNVTTAVYVQEFSVAIRETYPNGLFFRSDGLKMYTIGSDYRSVDEYSLSTAWNVSSAVYVQRFSVAGKTISPTSLFFRSDGLKMYTTDDVGDTVDEYSLSTAWNVTTATYVQEFSVTEIFPEDVFFRSDGLKMYITGYWGDSVYEYSLSTAWNVTTATYVQKFSVEGAPTGIFFRSDGSKMYTIGLSGDNVEEYNLDSSYTSNSSYIINISDAHDIIRVRAKAYNGETYSLEIESNVTINNSIPVINNLSISPAIAYYNDILYGYCSASDADDDALSYNYQWLLDGVLNSSGISYINNSINFTYQEDANQTNCANEYCDDDWSIDSQTSDESVYLFNYTKPSGVVSAIWQYANVGDGVELYNISIPSWCFDYDASRLILDTNFTTFSAQMRCYNGSWNTISSYGNYHITLLEEGIFWIYDDIIDVTNPIKGQNWTLSCQANDSISLSSWLNNSIVISNTATNITGAVVSILPSPATVLNNLTCNITGYSDGDVYDNLTFYYNWTIDGVLSSVHDVVLGSGNLSGSLNASCAISVNDGTANSSWIVSPLVSFADTSPPSMTYSLVSSGYTDTSYSIYINCSDTESGLASGYPKVSFIDPDNVLQGNYSLSLINTSLYQYLTTFSKVGAYTNFSFYCLDAQSNLNSSINTNITFISSTRPGVGGGGSSPPSIIVGFNDSLFSVSTSEGSVTPDIFLSVDGERTLFFDVLSKSSKPINVSLKCEGLFCSNVVYSKSIFTLASNSKETIVVKVSAPKGAVNGAVYSFDSIFSSGSSNSKISTTITISPLSLYLANYTDFSLMMFGVPKVLIYFVISGLFAGLLSLFKLDAALNIVCFIVCFAILGLFI